MYKRQVLTAATEEEEAVTVTDEEIGALTPEGYLTLVDDYHTGYSDDSGQQFITLVSKSGATFYLVKMCIRDRNYSEDDNPVALKADFILSLCESIMGSKDGLQRCV